MNELTRKDIKMTKGLAILSMVCLHLFCRTGNNVYGSPLLWVKDGVPLVYYFGFLSEMCVTMYCLCSGYAHFRLGETSGLTVKRNVKRIIKFLINYWIILILFSIIGNLVNSNDIPISLERFLGNVFLYSISYNGAWWFVATYVLLVLLSPIIYKIISNINWMVALLIALFQMIFFWFFSDNISSLFGGTYIGKIISIQIINLFGDVLFGYIVGMCIAKYNIITKLKNLNIKKWILFLSVVLISIFACVLHKSILMPVYAVFIFVVFNIWNKRNYTIRFFDYMGTHSTNIWLVHMFFYLVLFKGLVQKLVYPIPMFVGMIVICIICSYIINFIYKKILSLLSL